MGRHVAFLALEVHVLAPQSKERIRVVELLPSNEIVGRMAGPAGFRRERAVELSLMDVLVAGVAEAARGRLVEEEA